MGYDPATGELDDVFGPPDAVRSELLGSMSVFVAVADTVWCAVWCSNSGVCLDPELWCVFKRCSVSTDVD